MVIALLLEGGLTAMQTASVSTGILFLLVLFLMCFSLRKSLKRDLEKNNDRNGIKFELRKDTEK